MGFTSACKYVCMHLRPTVHICMHARACVQVQGCAWPTLCRGKRGELSPSEGGVGCSLRHDHLWLGWQWLHLCKDKDKDPQTSPLSKWSIVLLWQNQFLLTMKCSTAATLLFIWTPRDWYAAAALLFIWTPRDWYAAATLLFIWTPRDWYAAATLLFIWTPGDWYAAATLLFIWTPGDWYAAATLLFICTQASHIYPTSMLSNMQPCSSVWIW